MPIKSHLVLFLHNETALGPLTPVLYNLQSSLWLSFILLAISLSFLRNTMVSPECTIYSSCFKTYINYKTTNYPNQFKIYGNGCGLHVGMSEQPSGQTQKSKTSRKVHPSMEYTILTLLAGFNKAKTMGLIYITQNLMICSFLFSQLLLGLFQCLMTKHCKPIVTTFWQALRLHSSNKQQGFIHVKY